MPSGGTNGKTFACAARMSPKPASRSAAWMSSE